MPPPVIRHAQRDDCPAILAIYNEAVLTTTASYDIQPRSLQHRLAWFDDHHHANLPVFVADQDGTIVGWSSLSRYHDRFARIDGEWRFVERDYRQLDFTGDLSQHLRIAIKPRPQP